MNSGTMHFAEVLGIPTVAIFGQQTPSDVIGEGNIVPVYQVSAPCQPCGRATCNQPHLYCLTNLDPLIVARQLTQLAPA
jgi:ADP-heptose:LPS heptosyltransferase